MDLGWLEVSSTSASPGTFALGLGGGKDGAGGLRRPAAPCGLPGCRRDMILGALSGGCTAAEASTSEVVDGNASGTNPGETGLVPSADGAKRPYSCTNLSAKASVPMDLLAGWGGAQRGGGPATCSWDVSHALLDGGLH